MTERSAPRVLHPIALLALVTGLLLSFSLAYILHQRQVDQTRFAFERAAQDRILALQRRITTTVLAGHSMVSLFSASERVEESEFAIFAQELLENLRHIRALEWAPYVRNEQRAAFEADAARRHPGFQITELDAAGRIVTAAPREIYIPVRYLQPYTDNEMALGYDLASQPQRRAALEWARDRNQPSLTEAIKLVQNQRRDHGILLLYPVYPSGPADATPAQRQAAISGFIVVVIDVADLIETSLVALRPGGVHLDIYDQSDSATAKPLYHHHSRRQPEPHSEQESVWLGDTESLAITETITFLNREWRVHAYPAGNFYRTAISLEVGVVFFACLLASLSLFAYLYVAKQREVSLRLDNQILEDKVKERTLALEERNRELETYSYSIAHDLRSPLRSIISFSQILEEDAAKTLNKEDRETFQRIVKAAKYMSHLIDAILHLAHINRATLNKNRVDLSRSAREIVERLQAMDRNRAPIEWRIEPDLVTHGDPDLLNILLENLLGNAYKFTAQRADARIEFGQTLTESGPIFFVRDNGIGFDMNYVEGIFGAFRRLHGQHEFEGTGIGLSTAKRIVERHGGRIWAEASTGQGATFYFSLGCKVD